MKENLKANLPLHTPTMLQHCDPLIIQQASPVQLQNHHWEVEVEMEVPKKKQIIKPLAPKFRIKIKNKK